MRRGWIGLLLAAGGLGVFEFAVANRDEILSLVGALALLAPGVVLASLSRWRGLGHLRSTGIGLFLAGLTLVVVGVVAVAGIHESLRILLEILVVIGAGLLAGVIGIVLFIISIVHRSDPHQ